MKAITIEPIGIIQKQGQQFVLQIDEKFRPALLNIEGFSHLQILWWAHLTDKPQLRRTFILEKLFKKGPKEMGVFSTRSPVRPNPVLSSTIRVSHVDRHKGLIHTPFIDAEDGTPVLDIKPYFPMERVKDGKVPEWCAHWPQWQEDASSFDWKEEINMG